MSLNITSTSINPNQQPIFKPAEDNDEDLRSSGRYSQVDIGDFEESLFGEEIHDEHTLFAGLEDTHQGADYIDPLTDESYAQFADEVSGLISNVADPEMQAIFLEQFEATSKAASERLMYLGTKKGD